MGEKPLRESNLPFVMPEDVAKLRAKLEETLTIDPNDPLCALSNAELKTIIEGPRESNLTE